MEKISNSRGIHCKVAYKDQLRRFQLNGTEFSSFYSLVKQVLALEKEFVLKYKDNEGDLVTISSSEELACAVTQFEGNVIRFTVQETFDEQPEVADSSCATDCTTTGEFPSFRHCHGPKIHGCRGGRRGGHGGWGPHQEGHVPFPASWRERLMMKQEKIQSKLDHLSEEKELSPEQQWKQTCLQEKLKRISAKLGKLEGGWEKDWKSKEEKPHKKYEKHYGEHWKKHEKPCVDKSGKKEVLSDDVQIEIAKLRSQIEVLLPHLKEVKSQIKEKKMALQNIESESEKLLKEIAALKVVKKEHLIKLKPLQKKMKELKKGY